MKPHNNVRLLGNFVEALENSGNFTKFSKYIESFIETFETARSFMETLEDWKRESLESWRSYIESIKDSGGFIEIMRNFKILKNFSPRPLNFAAKTEKY